MAKEHKNDSEWFTKVGNYIYLIVEGTNQPNPSNYSPAS